jgi:hypothetical protein
VKATEAVSSISLPEGSVIQMINARGKAQDKLIEVISICGVSSDDPVQIMKVIGLVTNRAEVVVLDEGQGSRDRKWGSHKWGWQLLLVAVSLEVVDGLTPPRSTPSSIDGTRDTKRYRWQMRGAYAPLRRGAYASLRCNG